MFIIIILLLLVFAGMLVKLAADSRGMTVSLGLQEGRLSPCPASPNCVSSDAPEDDSHYIAPFQAPDAGTWTRLLDVLSTQEGYTQVAHEEDYVRYTSRTPVLGFIDDVEFHYRPDRQRIAIRSASRVGYGDMNTNRKRLEQLRAILETGETSP